MRSRNRLLLKVVAATFMLSLVALTGCGDKGVTPSPADASEQPSEQPDEQIDEQPTEQPDESGYDTFQPRRDDGVDVVYFEEEGACDCMAEVGDAVEHSIRSNFAAELESGELRFFIIASDDPANRATVETFEAQLFDMFIVEYADGQGNATPVYEIWTLWGDDDAIESYVKALVEGALAGQT